ncbi:unnamed protein product [Urochloa decumbens]|uniref:BHLH domain-containing protein n=1 Tax=Urochloa decumbens TaxID=240449 RepID=A0ABC8ZS70_9POAL
MDSTSWLHGYINNTTGNNGFMCGYAAGSSCTPEELQYREEEEQQFLISSQIRHHLNQISVRMNMEDDEGASVYALSSNDGSAVSPIDTIVVDGLLDTTTQHHHGGGSFPSSSSSSSLSLPSASLSCSPASSAAHVLAAPATSQYLEVSSHVLLPPPPTPAAAPYGDHRYTANLHVPAAATAVMAPEMPAVAATNGSGAFKRYARHLGPRRPPKPGACGQRMFKTAMSVLSKMHAAARYKQQQQQQQYYYQQAAAAEAPPASVNQLQHMISERKRREKLNDSFHALRTVLPPGSKKDKTSILIRAREYVRSLESKVSELEEKNRSLESRLLQRDSGGAGKDAGGGEHGSSGEKKVQVEITRAAEPCGDLCTLKIAVMRSSSTCNMTDVMLRALQCLRDQIGDGVSLVAMSTSDSATGTVLALQIKSPPGVGWEEQPVKDAVGKVVADALI